MKKTISALLAIFTVLTAAADSGNTLKIGWAKTDITPLGPTMLRGLTGNRLAVEAVDPLTAVALYMESGDERVIMISVDLIQFSNPLMKRCRKIIAAETGIKPENIIGCATHTHTAPQFGTVVPKEKAMRYYPSEIGTGNRGIDVAEIRKKHPDFVDSEQYFDFLIKKVSSVAVEAWKNRSKGSVAYGMGTAAIGSCRRLVLDKEGPVMYADETNPDFLNAEGSTDDSVNILASYGADGKLSGLVINIACPAQASEALQKISADFWHEIRQEVARLFGKNVYVLPQCSAAGDQSPHVMLRRKADARMMYLRGQLDKNVTNWKWVNRAFNAGYNFARRKEIARRVGAALTDVLGVIGKDKRDSVVLKHVYRKLDLPARKITAAEAKAAKINADIAEKKAAEEKLEYNGYITSCYNLIERYRRNNDIYPVEIHILRVGDVVFASNPFELYLDYGDRIKGRSKAEQTFLIQLSGNGSYLPSLRADGKGYGSTPRSCQVSWQGGKMLIEETIKEIDSLF